MVNSGLPAEGNQRLHAVRVPVCASVPVFLLVVHRTDFEVVDDGGEGMVVIAESSLPVKLVPQFELPDPAQSSPADAEEVEHVAVSSDNFHFYTCFAHGISPFRSFFFQPDALEIPVAVPDCGIVRLDRLAVIGTLPFLFFASHADDILVEHGHGSERQLRTAPVTAFFGEKRV